MNIPHFMDTELFEVQKELKTIFGHVKKKSGIYRVKIETYLLSGLMKIMAERIIIDSAADYIKAST